MLPSKSFLPSPPLSFAPQTVSFRHSRRLQLAPIWINDLRSSSLMCTSQARAASPDIHITQPTRLFHIYYSLSAHVKHGRAAEEGNSKTRNLDLKWIWVIWGFHQVYSPAVQSGNPLFMTEFISFFFKFKAIGLRVWECSARPDGLHCHICVCALWRNHLHCLDPIIDLEGYFHICSCLKVN